jgi:hypothetical protein
MPLVLGLRVLMIDAVVVAADGQRHFGEGRRESIHPHPPLPSVTILPSLSYEPQDGFAAARI